VLLTNTYPTLKGLFMIRQQVDYDAVAPTYNRRFAEVRWSRTLVALQEIMQVVPGDRILEVGCGTGHWLVGLNGAAKSLYGIDLSTGMLAQAQDRALPYMLTCGRAEALPFAASSFGLVYCVNAIHHFTRPDEFIRQARTVLRDGGVLAVLGMDPRIHRHDWYVYHYFDGVYETELRRFPSWEQLQVWMAQCGFERFELRLVDELGKPKYGREVLQDPFLEKNATSQLILLSDEAYAAGLEHIRHALENAERMGEILVFQNTIRIQMLTGWTEGTRLAT
jgi:SAM-dependent methyltransferase